MNAASLLLTLRTGDLERLAPHRVSDALEEGHIVHFPVSPVPFPAQEDLRFLWNETPGHLTRKNTSHHPEAGRVVGLGGPRGVRERTLRILEEHGLQVRCFLQRTIPALTRDWTVATSSYRPLQERERRLSRHASNERIHVDARVLEHVKGVSSMLLCNIEPSD